MSGFLMVLTVTAILIHLFLMEKKSLKKIVEVALLYMLVIMLGVGAMAVGALHILAGPEIAARIGWMSGSPFQFEVGAADIALGFVCFLCLFFRGPFWLAAILGQCTFLFLCMIGHVRDYLSAGNVAAYNIGWPIILADVVTPFILISLYIAHRKFENNSPS